MIIIYLEIQNVKKMQVLYDMKTGWLIERQMTKSPELIPTDFILITVQQFHITKVYININYTHKKGISFLFFSFHFFFYLGFILSIFFPTPTEQ